MKCPNCGENTYSDGCCEVCGYAGAAAETASPLDAVTLKLSDILTQRGYELSGRHLGGGQFGDLFEGYSPARGRRVAVKKFEMKGADYSGGMSRSIERAQEKFMQEAAVMALCDCDYIPRVYDRIGTDECRIETEQGVYSGCAYVTELIDGKDVGKIYFAEDRAEAIKEFPVAEVFTMTVQMLRALCHLKDRDILHCDIKPDNIMYGSVDGKEMRYYLVDYGLACVHPSGKAPGGTPGYEAHEAAADCRFDMFSLGQTVYTCLCGIQPRQRELGAEEDNRVERTAAFERAKAAYPDYETLFSLAEACVKNRANPESRPDPARALEVLTGEKRVLCFRCGREVEPGASVCGGCGSYVCEAEETDWPSVYGGADGNLFRPYVTHKRYDAPVSVLHIAPSKKGLLISDGALFTLAGDDTIVRFDLKGVGEETDIYPAAERKLDAPAVRTGAILDGELYLPLAGGALLKLDKNLKETGRFSLPGGEATQPLTAADGFVYAVTDGGVYQMSGAGQFRFVKADSRVTTPVTLVQKAGRAEPLRWAVFGDENGMLHFYPTDCFDAPGLVSKQFQYKDYGVRFSGAKFLAPVVHYGGDGLIFFVSERLIGAGIERAVQCVDVSSCAVQWLMTVDKAYNAPVVAGNRLYLATKTGLLCRDLTAGTHEKTDKKAYRKVVCFSNRAVGEEYELIGGNFAMKNEFDYNVSCVWRDYVFCRGSQGNIYVLGE